MKKITLLITLLLMAGLMLVACGGGTTTPTTTEETAPETSTEVEEPVEEVVEEPAEEVAEEPVEEPAEEMAEEPVEEPAAETEASSSDRVQVRWFVGLGTGGSEPQIERQNAVVEEFNASQDEIELVLEIVQNEVARDALATLIASGDAPDIVGPVGNEGAYFFPDTWLDLQPLIDSSGYDLSQYPETSVEFYRTADGGLDGIPFAVFPAMIFYNVDLFDEAGLNYPPHVVGEPYVMPDGTEAPWNFDTLAEVAKMLTVDANGNDATSPDFDRENIVQFGYHNQWIQTIRALCNPYGPAELIDADGNAVWPDSYQECIDYMHNAIWVDNFAPNQAQQDSELLATPNQFGSGNVGMALTHLWFTCCLVDAPVSNWDLAVAPANSSGETAVKLHADTYRIYRGTEVPEEAFTVLTYLLGEAAPSLLEVYGALPIRADEQAAFFASQDELYTQGVDWSVVNESLNYVESPGHESNMPNYTEAVTRTNALYSLLFTDGAADLDAEIATFLTDLQAIFDAAQ